MVLRFCHGLAPTILLEHNVVFFLAVVEIVLLSIEVVSMSTARQG